MPHGLHRTTTTTLALATTVGLALTGCTGDTDTDDVAAPGSTPEATAAPDETTAGASPTASPEDEAPSSDGAMPVVPTTDVPELDAQCVLEPGADAPQVERIRFSVPAAWKVEDRCDILDPELEELPEQTEVDAAIFVDVSNVDFGMTRESVAKQDATTWLGARANYQAVREVFTTSGEGKDEAGMPRTAWTYDLDAGTDDKGGVLTMATGVDDADAYATATATLDAIAQTVVLDPVAVETSGFAVLRTEGGATPFTVTYDDGCFAYRPGGPQADATDELCDLDPRDGEIVAGTVGDAVVGHASPFAVAVQSDALAGPYGLTTSVEGGTVFALPADELPATLTAIGPGGEELVTADVR